MTREPPAYDDLPLTQFITFRLARLQARLNAQAARILKDASGLSLTQWRIIAWLGWRGPTRASDISRLAQIDKGLFSRKLKTLVAQGVLTSEPDKTDQRQHMLRLTAEGTRLFETTLPVMQRRQRALTGALTPEELTTFFAVLDKLEPLADIETFDP